MAQVYILFGVAQDQRAQGHRRGRPLLRQGARHQPAAKIPPTMATKAVKAAFAKAEDVDPATIGDLSEADVPRAEEAVQEGGGQAAAAAAEQEKQEKAERPPPRREEEAGRGGGTEAGRGRAQAGRRRTASAPTAETTRSTLVDELAQAKVAESQLKVDRDKLKQRSSPSQGPRAASRKRRRPKDKQIADAQPKISSSRRTRPTATASSGPAARRSRSSRRRRPRRTSRSRR
jgi:hypothetical protein